MTKNKVNRNQPIGIFDSGVGGLTVLREVEKIMPQEDIIYFGDTARVPYGNKSASTIRRFSVESVLFLLQQDVKMVIVACNTASALALDYLTKSFRIPIVGVIDSGVERALQVTSGRIGIIGTKSTIKSRSYQKAIASRNKRVKFFSCSCPLFVPLVEEGFAATSITSEFIQKYLKGLKSKQIDTLILGCTHYPLLKKEITGYLCKVSIIDSAHEVARRSKLILDKLKLNNRKRPAGRQKFFVSDEPHNFTNLAKLFLKRPISKPKVVNV